MLDLIARVKDSGKALTGSLEFLNDWDYFSNCLHPPYHSSAI